MLPIVLMHGYSSEGRNNTAEEIYGNLPELLRSEFGNQSVIDINLSRWISLNDGIGIDDVSFAMERALSAPRYRALLDTGFNVIIHSTGALVARNWIRLFERKPSPIANLVHLAGANFGSGLAHVGQGEAARWSRLIFQGVGRGTRVLDELEFGSSKTIDMHRHFLEPGNDMYDDYEVQEFCIIGSQTLGALRMVPIRYVKEDSADNTVRTSAGNLNFNYVPVNPTADAYSLSVKQLKTLIDERLENKRLSGLFYKADLSHLAAGRRAVPFAIPYETAHFGSDIGILLGSKNRRQIVPLIVKALSTPFDGQSYKRVAADFDRVTRKTFERVAKLKASITEWDKQAQYEGHVQLVFRLRDQFGNAVSNYDVTFRSSGPRSANRIETMIEDKHVHRKDRGSTTYYLRTQKFARNTGWGDRLGNLASVDFEITGLEPGSDDVAYIPLSVRLSPANVRTILQTFRTTIVDVQLVRLPSRNVFQLSTT